MNRISNCFVHTVPPVINFIRQQVSILHTYIQWPFTQVKNLNDRKWSHVEAQSLSLLMQKLDGSPLTPDHSLTFEETHLALKTILRWRKSLPDESQLPTHVQDFIRHLKNNNYIREPTDPEHTWDYVENNIEVYFHELEHYTPDRRDICPNYFRASSQAILSPVLFNPKGKNKPGISVCFISSDINPNCVEDELKKAGYRWIKTMKLVVWLTQKWMGEFSHVNFIEHSERASTIHGLGNSGFYHKDISGRYNPHIEEFEINGEALFPENQQGITKERFHEAFTAQLKQLISDNYPRFSVPPRWGQKIRRACLARWGWSALFRKPYDVVLYKIPIARLDPRELFCSEFVCEAIIHAHVNACCVLKIPYPTSLSFYGLRYVDGILPDPLKSAFVRKGILKQSFNPLR